MKKTLLAAALIAGYAGAASAQNSVTLYGVVSVGLQYESVNAPDNVTFKDGSTSASRFGMVSGQQNGSRWGVKGVEDLGNGLKASFVYESGVNVTNGSSSGFTRQATLALNSDSWGGLQFGRAVSPGTVAYSGIDPFGSSFGSSSQTSSQGQTFIRYSNMLQYSTPTISGFRALVGYSFDTGLSSNSAASGFNTNNKDRAASAGLRYANGPIVIAGIFDYVMSNNLNPANATNDTNIKSWTVGGTYDFKVVKLHAAYGQNIDGILGSNSVTNLANTGGDTNSASAAVFSKGGRTQSWMVGLSAPVGAAGKVFGSVQQRIAGGTFDQAFTGTQTTASIGYTYNMSKRTNLYAFYSYENNVANLKGATSNTVGAGIVHRF